MFERYMDAKRPKPRKWVWITLTGSIIAHVLAGVTVIAYSFWKIEKLHTKRTDISFFSAARPQLPKPPAGKPKAAPKKKTAKVVKAQPKLETLQPVQVQPLPDKPPETEATTTDSSSEFGTEGGSEGGSEFGTGDGEGGDGPPEPPKPAPQNIAQQMIEGQRISGNTQILAPDSVLMAASGQGLDTIRAKVKLCLDASGHPASITFERESDFPALDDKIRAELERWRYRPYVVAGKAVPVCFPITFKYKLSK